jgi:hypothetical protein
MRVTCDFGLRTRRDVTCEAPAKRGMAWEAPARRGMLCGASREAWYGCAGEARRCVEVRWWADVSELQQVIKSSPSSVQFRLSRSNPCPVLFYDFVIGRGRRRWANDLLAAHLRSGVEEEHRGEQLISWLVAVVTALSSCTLKWAVLWRSCRQQFVVLLHLHKEPWYR